MLGDHRGRADRCRASYALWGYCVDHARSLARDAAVGRSTLASVWLDSAGRRTRRPTSWLHSAERAPWPFETAITFAHSPRCRECAEILCQGGRQPPRPQRMPQRECHGKVNVLGPNRSLQARNKPYCLRHVF